MATERTKTAPLPPGPCPETPPAAGRAVRTRARALALGSGGSALALALLGLNAWWAWRDVRPVADLPAVSNWISRGRLAEAEWALRERLRRSPHDGAALALLARLLATRGDWLGCGPRRHPGPFRGPNTGTLLFLPAPAAQPIDWITHAQIRVL